MLLLYKEVQRNVNQIRKMSNEAYRQLFSCFLRFVLLLLCKTASEKLCTVEMIYRLCTHNM